MLIKKRINLDENKYSGPYELVISCFYPNDTTFIISPNNKSTSIIKQPTQDTKITENTETKQENYEINRLRVIYFFSISARIADFLKKLTVTFTLVNKNKEVIAEGKSNLLNDYLIYNENVLKADKHRRFVHVYTYDLKPIKIDVFFDNCFLKVIYGIMHGW